MQEKPQKLTGHQDDARKMQPDAPKGVPNNVYLLIDAAQYPGIWRILQYRFRRLPWLPLSGDTGSDADTINGAVLIHIESNQTRTLAWFLEHTQDTYCMSWIVSPLTHAALRDHLSGLTHIEAEDGSLCLMRYYDTRTLPVWHHMLEDGQKAYALGPITTWNYINREGVPGILRGQGCTVAPEQWFLRLTQEQEQMLLDATYPDLIIQQLETNGNADLNAMPATQRYRFIADQIDKARKQYAIESTPEIVLFCSLALAIGRNFDKLVPVAQALRNFTEGTPSARQISRGQSREQLA